MTDNLADLDADDGDESEGNSNAAKSLRAELKKTKARLAELETENTTFKAKEKKQTVAQAFEKFNAKPSLARFYDGEGTEEDDVLAWLKENGDDFGWTEDGADTDDADGDTVEQARRIGQLSTSAPQRNLGPRITPEWIRTASREDLQKAGVL